MLVYSLLKVPSSKLREVNFNYEVSLKKADTEGYVIGIGESQVIEWIYNERGMSMTEVQQTVSDLKASKKYDAVKDLLFMNELLQIEFSSKKDLDKIMKQHRGIVTVNGIRYKYLVSKGSEVLTYVKEDLHEEFSKRLNAGRNVNEKVHVAKLSAYKSLAFTNSETVTAPKNVIVIKDCEVEFEEKYLWVGATEESIEERKEKVVRDICDGCSFISPELAEQWSKDLRKEKITSAYQVRQLWTKGILFPVDYKKYCLEHGVTTITDIWGHERNILESDMILTESMVKLGKAYDSMEDWLQAGQDYGYNWRVGKVAKEDKFGNSNYQQLLPIHLTKEDCKDFIQPQIDYMKRVAGQDYDYTYLFLNGVDNTEKSIQRLFNADNVDFTLSNAVTFILKKSDNAIANKCLYIIL